VINAPVITKSQFQAYQSVALGREMPISCVFFRSGFANNFLANLFS